MSSLRRLRNLYQNSKIREQSALLLFSQPHSQNQSIHPNHSPPAPGCFTLQQWKTCIRKDFGADRLTLWIMLKIFQGRPRREDFCYWYTANTNLFWLTILVTRKSETQLGWIIKPVQHNLVWRIRSWRIKLLEKDFKYLYWTISKMIFWNLFTCKVTYIIDLVARAG